MAHLSEHRASPGVASCCQLQLTQSSPSLGIITQRCPLQADVIEKLKEITEPNANYFHKGGYTLAVDLAIAECITKAHVARNQVPLLFIIFARFFRIKIPVRTIKVPLKKVDGRMTYAEREVSYIPGRTHVKEVCATLNQAHKLQIGVQLLETENDSYTYIADGAESLQSEWLSQLLSHRDANGKLQITALDLSILHSKTAEAQNQAFKESLRLITETCRSVGMIEEALPRLIDFKPTATMNDRAAAARKAARLARGGNGSGEGTNNDMVDDPTCAHHAITNIFEDGRKAIDAVMHDVMNISAEQQASDAAKVKAMRTCVGWFSSPACSLIYQCSKYVALFSSKGYAVGAKFRKWLEAEEHLKAEERLEGELLGAIEDMLAICGSRDYVFFMDAAVTDRFAQEGSLLTFLEEEADMGTEAGGKLRNAILTGFRSDGIKSAVRALAIICDAALWVLLRCIGSDDHILDVLPKMWTRSLDFFERAALSPQLVVEGSLTLIIEGVREAKHTPRAQRAAIDMQRIRRLSADNTLVERMVAAAFAAMAAATRNHASEFLEGGVCASENITPELRERLNGCPMTSTSAERMFALGRAHDKRAGATRDDTKAGVVLGGMDSTVEFMRGRVDGEAEWRKLRKLARLGMKETMAQKWLKVGLAERAVRDSKLTALRAKRAAKAAEKARLEAVPLATRYSHLLSMSNEALKDQLKKHKAMGKVGFTLTQPNRTAFVLQVQTLLLEADKEANDLAEGDSGIEGRNIKRKVSSAAKKGKRKARVTEYMGYEWTEEEEDDFEVEAIVGRLVADGSTAYANQGKAKKGTILYRIVWKSYPPDMVWYEPASNLGRDLIDEFEALMAAEEASDEAEARDEHELDTLEEEEDLPPP